MSALITLLDFAGYVALLLWGVHMVQTGVQRAFGAALALPWGVRWAPACGPSPPAWASPRRCRAAPPPA